MLHYTTDQIRMILSSSVSSLMKRTRIHKCIDKIKGLLSLDSNDSLAIGNPLYDTCHYLIRCIAVEITVETLIDVIPMDLQRQRSVKEKFVMYDPIFCFSTHIICFN